MEHAGGGTGIGLMVTQALASNGAKVYITGRTRSKLDNVVSTYGGDKVAGEIIALEGDVGSKEGVQKLYEDYSAKEKCLCILVNNAGISTSSVQTEVPDESKHGSVEAAKELRQNLFTDDANTYGDWAESYNTNVTGLYFMTTAFLDLLQKSTETHNRWSATVLNISSISGLIKSAQHHFAYNASKGAAVHLTRMLANEIVGAEQGRIKVRVNGIAPGVFPSEMTTKEEADDAQKSHIPAEKYESKVPAGRPGKDEDMAQAVLFCVSNQYLNGQTVVVDGGYTLAAGY